MRSLVRLLVLAIAVGAMSSGLLAPAQAVSTASVSGTITGPGGAELDAGTRLDIHLQRQGDDEFLDVGVLYDRTSPDFTFSGLEAGTYRVYVEVSRGSYVVDTNPTFDLVTGQSLSGVTLALARPASVSGHAVATGGSLPTDDGLYVSLERQFSVDGDTIWDWMDGVNLDEDGSFRFDDLVAGTYRLRIASNNDTYGGASSVFELAAGDSPTVDVVVVRNTLVSGTVSVAGGSQAHVHPVLEVFRDGVWQDESENHIDAPGGFSLALVVGSATRLAFDVFRDDVESVVRIYWNGTVGGTRDPAGATIFTPVAGQDMAGRNITVTPTGQYVPPAPAAAPAPPAAPSQVVKAKAGKGKATITIVVATPGAPAPSGKVTVWRGKTKLKTVRVVGGKATIRLTKLKKGKQKLALTYSGGGGLPTGRRLITIKVR